MQTIRHTLAAVAAAAVGAVPTVTYAHGVVGDGHDSGSRLLWLYGIVLGVVAGLILFRIYLRSSGRLANKERTRRLAELERTLTSHQTAVRNADDYPNQYGLSRADRQSRMDAIATLRRLIDEEKLKLSSATNDAQSIET